MKYLVCRFCLNLEALVGMLLQAGGEQVCLISWKEMEMSYLMYTMPCSAAAFS